MNELTAMLNRFWPTKIRSRLILGISLVHLGLMTIFVFDLVNRQKQFLQKENHQQLESFAGTYAINSKAYLIANDFEGLERLTESYSNFPNLRYAMIVSPEGSILAHSNTQYIGKTLSDSVSLSLKNDTKTKILIENDDVADLAAPIEAEGKIVGWSRVSISQDSINRNLSDIIRNGFMYIIIALVSGAFFAMFIGNKLSNGLYKLISVANKIKEGDRNVRASGFKNFELGELGIAVNQMLDKISANEKLLNMVVEHLPVGLWILSKNGDVLSSNPAGKQLWKGSSHKSIDGSGVYQGWVTETGKLIEPLQSAIDRAIEKGQTIINDEVEIETFDKHHKFILNSAIPLVDHDNEIIGAIAINVDITERKKITEKLALSESTLSGAFEYSATGMAIVSLEGRFMKVNAALCKMVGYSEKEFLELTIKDISCPDTISGDIDFLEKAGKGRSETYGTEKRYFHKNGSTVWINLNASLVKDNEGRPLYFVSQIENISEKKKISDQLKEKESLLRIFIEHSPAALAMFDNEMKYIQVSKRWLTDYNLAEEYIIGKSFYEISPTTPNRWKNIHQKCLAGSIEKCEEDSFVRTDGSLDWLQWEVHPWRIASGEIGGIIILTEVITERKESELKFKNLVEKSLVGVYIIQKGKFVYVNPRFAHDLGYTQEEMLNIEDVTQIVFNDYMPPALEQWREKVETGLIDDLQIELKYKRKNGEVIWAEVNVSETLYKGGQAIIGTWQDITERKNAEAAIKEQAETFGAIIENTNESIWLLSPDLKVLQFNKTGKDRLLLNRGKEIYIGADFREFLHAGAEDVFYSVFNDALAGNHAEVESYQRNFLGEFFWLRTRMYPIYDGAKKMIGITVLAENISARKKSEKMILQFSRLYQFTSAINEMMLRTENKQAIFQEACEIAVRHGKFSMAWIGNFSAETRNMECFAFAGNNNGYLENLKVSVGESAFGRGVIGNAFRNRKAYYCNDIAGDPDMMAWKDDALKQGYRSLISLPVIIGSKLEAIFTLYTEETSFFNEEEVKLIQEVTNNIAYAIEKIELQELQKKSEQELKESEEKFRKLVEETLVGVFILQDARFVYVNPQFEKISGYSKLELLNGMSFEELIHEDDLDKAWKNYLSRITGEKSSDHYFLKCVTKEGIELQVEVIASTITYKGNPATIATIIDVTEQVAEEIRINKAVTHAQESERQQISMELHDNVKQIMAASLLNIDFIRMNLKDEKKTIELIGNVKNYIREGIDELRRISHQLSPLVDDMIPLQEKIKTVVNTMNITKGISVSYHFDKFNKPLENDLQIAIYRILQEQFSNIMKYAKASTVEITVHKNKNDLSLSIKDNGIGFDTKLKKSGIGLENIRRRVNVFNGKVNIESSPGKGCNLEVKIPVLS